MREERFIIKVLEMYYKQGLSQREISRKLKVSDTTISRTLTQARKEGYVQIQINYPNGAIGEIENVLEEQFELKEAIVAAGKNEEELLENVALQAADFLIRNLHDDMTISITRGRSIYKMIECLSQDVRLKFLKVNHVDVAPLVSMPYTSTSKHDQASVAHSSYMLEEFARLIHGNAHHIPVPEYVVDSRLKGMLMKEPSVKEVVDIVKEADMAFVGIGVLKKERTNIFLNPASGEEYKRLLDKGGIGEIISYPYDKEGRPVEDIYNTHVMGIGLEEFVKIPVRVGVAYGLEKKEAIMAALKGKLINVLVTDEKVADYLIAE